MTPNQLVAYNLKRARQLKGWTQQETVERLAPHLGTKLSRANYSLMESSWERETRIRNFTADDLVAFAKTFEIEVLWFLLPPVEEEEDAGIMVAGIDPAGYLDMVWPQLELAKTDPGLDPAVGALEKRLVALAPILGFDITERARAAVQPQAAKAVLAAMPTVLEFIRVLDEGAGALHTWVDTLKGYLSGNVIDPAWERALEIALAGEEGSEEE